MGELGSMLLTLGISPPMLPASDVQGAMNKELVDGGKSSPKVCIPLLGMRSENNLETWAEMVEGLRSILSKRVR